MIGYNDTYNEHNRGTECTNNKWNICDALEGIDFQNLESNMNNMLKVKAYESFAVVLLILIAAFFLGSGTIGAIVNAFGDQEPRIYYGVLMMKMGLSGQNGAKYYWKLNGVT